MHHLYKKTIIKLPAESAISSGNKHFFLWSNSCVGTWTFFFLHLLTGTSLHSFHVICLQSGLVWVLQWELLLISQVKVLVICEPFVGSGSWYQSSCLSAHVTSGTINWTSFSLSSHSCQVTGSHCSVPAQI